MRECVNNPWTRNYNWTSQATQETPIIIIAVEFKQWGCFPPVYSLIVTINLLLILLSKVSLFLNLVKHTSEFSLSSKDYESALIFSQASVIAELLAML